MSNLLLSDDGDTGFGVELAPARETVLVKPNGELDLATVAQLRAPVDELLAAGFTRIVIDLRSLTFIDATGLGLLLALAHQAREDGWQLGIIPGADRIHRIFELTDTLDQLPIRSPTDRLDLSR